jgi:hypothetical protein
MLKSDVDALSQRERLLQPERRIGLRQGATVHQEQKVDEKDCEASFHQATSSVREFIE